MKVRCIGNRGSNLPPALLDPKSNRDENTLFALTIGKTYVVYGLTVYRSFLWYYLCDEEFTYFPIWNPEWALDPYYYEHLSENRDEEVQIFTKYQKLMDEEYD